jgi:hypothetical protein
MSRRLFHLRILKERREKRHEYFSWLMKNWIYTIFYLLIHLSYKDRNIYNSIFWTIWSKWCFLRSEKLCHLFWIRFKFFFVVISLRFIWSLFSARFTNSSHLRQLYDAISSCKDIDFDIFLNDIFKSHFWIEHHLKRNLFQHAVEIIIINVFSDVESFDSIVWLIIDIIFLNKTREFDFVFRFVRSFANDKRCCIVNIFTNDNRAKIKIWKWRKSLDSWQWKWVF